MPGLYPPGIQLAQNSCSVFTALVISSIIINTNLTGNNNCVYIVESDIIMLLPCIIAVLNKMNCNSYLMYSNYNMHTSESGINHNEL